jgi:alpha-1,3-rhamnosyl/mannosyltransferase
MRVVLSAEALQPPLTGIGIYTLGLLRALAAIPGVDMCHVHDLRLHRTHRNLAEPIGARRWPAGLVPRALQRRTEDIITLSSGADIVHGTNFRLFSGGRKRVVTVHDLVRLRFPEFMPPERRKRMASDMRRALAQADLILTPSEAIRIELINAGFRGQHDVVSTPLGIAPDWRPLSEAETAPVLARWRLSNKAFVLATGTIEPRKNLVKLIAAYRLLPATLRRAVPLVLCGKPGWQSRESLAAIEDASAEGWLRYIGYAARADLHALTASAALAVQASVYEGFCLPLLEAMACGTKVLASRDPALAELAGEAVAVLPPMDSRRMSELIEQALTDTRSDPAFMAKAHAMSWDACASLTVQAYSRLLGR